MINTDRPWLRTACWILFAAFLLALVAFAGHATRLADALAACGIVITFLHGGRVLGWGPIILFLAICLVVAFAMENLSIATGFPFGHYHFEIGAGLPHIGAVPIIVGPLYFAMGYCAWMIASLLLDGADLHLERRGTVIALPIAAAFVLVQWDVVMDPINATLYRSWIWHEGGRYFGVPLSNYAGWFLTVWLIFQAFALSLHARARPVRPRRHSAWLVPILLYLAVALSYVPPALSGGDGEVIDASGQAWRIADIKGATLIALVFTMGFTAVLALLRWVGATGTMKEKAEAGSESAGARNSH